MPQLPPAPSLDPMLKPRQLEPGQFVIDPSGRRLMDPDGRFYVHDPDAGPCCGCGLPGINCPACGPGGTWEFVSVLFVEPFEVCGPAWYNPPGGGSFEMEWELVEFDLGPHRLDWSVYTTYEQCLWTLAPAFMVRRRMPGHPWGEPEPGGFNVYYVAGQSDAVFCAGRVVPHTVFAFFLARFPMLTCGVPASPVARDNELEDECGIYLTDTYVPWHLGEDANNTLATSGRNGSVDLAICMEARGSGTRVGQEQPDINGASLAECDTCPHGMRTAMGSRVCELLDNGCLRSYINMLQGRRPKPDGCPLVEKEK